MKLVIHQSKVAGSVLVTTLVLAAILGTTLAGYLYWARTQNLLVAQSQAWNAALAYAEAGIEEGMAQINFTYGTNYLNSAQANWGGGLLSGYYGPRSHSFSEGSYSAIIIPASPGPTIISTGYTMVPYIGRQVSRIVRVTTTTSATFGNAITVRSNLTTKGNNLTVDSYDSSDPNHSTTNGLYDPVTRKAGGDINSTDGLINVQNANIYGKLRTGPNGSFSLGNGTVGDLDWNVKGQIEPGWYANDFNAEFKDVAPPYSTGLDVPSVDNKTNKIYYLNSGGYIVNGDFVMSQNEYLVVQGVATLYVTGNFNMKSQNECSIIVTNGGSLKLYVGTTDGAPVVSSLTQVNVSGNAYSFHYYGLPSNTSLTWNGNNTYMGVIYCPQADISLGGGGSSYYDYQGAMVGLSASLNGHFNVHYDENLRRIGLPSGFTVTSWREI